MAGAQISDFKTDLNKLISFVRTANNKRCVCVFLSTQGYWGPRVLIAAQTPLPDTMGDFWMMIYQKKAVTIVMLSDCNEEDKVSKASCVLTCKQLLVVCVTNRTTVYRLLVHESKVQIHMFFSDHRSLTVSTGIKTRKYLERLRLRWPAPTPSQLSSAATFWSVMSR